MFNFKPRNIAVLGLMQVCFLTGCILLSGLFIRVRAFHLGFPKETQLPSSLIFFVLLRDYGFILYSIPLLIVVFSYYNNSQTNSQENYNHYVFLFSILFLLLLILIGISTPNIMFIREVGHSPM